MPATVGQRGLTVHIQVVTSSYKELIRYDTIQFKIDHNQRTREIPSDRLDELFFDEDAIEETHEALSQLICNQDMVPYLANDIYGTIGPFKHITTLLDPIPLYGRYFNMSDPTNTKIAGYKTYSTFLSPRFYVFDNPLTC